ncbi:hypothetical protein SeMB42_g04623 [Synchytrium endobioticum]|uniref:Nucleolar GTP-binding protein 1 n=1 Tax=Synchytrium endobioticum TaxID=286115 RepID=A0A507D8I0_9FUNG|nr:hypothetical protein SeMB42_g04623 [Synchytrium endobioticum]TPX47909.1 hypothetical protein SeLEV6574_g02369 [Synchytrium endobioticum]
MAHSFYNFKKITVVPTSSDFIDVVLSKIQRKTPTVVHPNYKITRIRTFYLRKVKFAQDCFDEKLNQILTDFPKLDEVHPFYADLMNVLYDRDHYKLALGQINTARHLIDNVAKDYARILKYGDSLYRCKQLKRAALGRMATIMKRQKDSLAYLEQVRQHLSRLPSIDPNTRTMIICGYPNVGKSSFMNRLTRADVEVQPYAFTTKSLFVGHLDYQYLRWQVIDTPGVLDHPLEHRNTIEMQSITALAHLRACILYFMDLSEQCGYSVSDQIKLYESIKPLFANKPTMIVINKIDVMKPEQLNPTDQALLKHILERDKVILTQLSCLTEEGVMDVRNQACDMLLASRVEMKMKGHKVKDILNKLHLAAPMQRDDKARPAFVPEGAIGRVKYDKADLSRRKLERDIEVENGGAGVYNIDLKKNYMLKDEEWKHDKIPEILDGKNVADFVDADIEARLLALEEEEEKLAAEGFYNADEEMEDSDEEILKLAAAEVQKKKDAMIIAHRLKKNMNRPILPAKIQRAKRTVDNLHRHMKSVGVDVNKQVLRARSKSLKRGRSETRVADAMDVDRSASRGPRAHTVTRDRSVMGLRDDRQKEVADHIKKHAQKPFNFEARRGEADRHISAKKPKHLFAGKRGIGKTQRR